MQPDYLIVLPIDPMLVGDLYAKGEELPLHCTLMPWFRLSSSFSRERLNYELMVLGTGLDEGFIELISDYPEYMGHVLAHILKRDARLLLLHTRLLISLVKINSQPRDVEWIGAGYRPHVTNRTDKLLVPYRRHRVTDLALLERDKDGTKKVVYSRALNEIPF
jgi:hypothetical protein